MTTTSVDTRTIGHGAHQVETLTPVRSGELRKVSTRCTCGWRTVGIARELDEAAAVAHSRAEDHVAESLETASDDEVGPAVRDRRWTRLVRNWYAA
ncbi:hypothetical protein [uncultured Nocardioides sp.]|uniref:hypothetical protein n=1 Tax=uncultured Nocardioides sp. TaxID=198441 RepID=UPI00261A7022|nr:hypothetical protein [uncultured Nocardioides sp.]